MSRRTVSLVFIGLFVALATVLQCLDVPQPALAQEAQPDQTAIIQHLNAAVTWYKQLMAANDSAGHPSDTYYLDNARDLAKQAVPLAFQSAEAEAALLPTGKGNETFSTDQQNLAKAASDAAAQSQANPSTDRFVEQPDPAGFRQEASGLDFTTRHIARPTGFRQGASGWGPEVIDVRKRQVREMPGDYKSRSMT